jgi:multisubunit Na+/H+ antiporter MnhE subunit
MAQMQGEIKRNIASLVGGIVIAFVVFVLWMLVTRELGYAGTTVVVLGAIVGTLTGGYVRLADL